MAKRRPSGDGMVRRRDDGRWEGRIVVGHKKDGSPIFRHILAPTQKELLDKLHQNIQLYQDVELTEDCRITLAVWLDRWLEEYVAGTVRESTLSSQVYRSRGQLVVSEPKTKASIRTIILPPAMVSLLRAHKKNVDSPIWPDGKKHPRNIYAHSREECEEKLAEVIAQVKAEIAAAKAAMRPS